MTSFLIVKKKIFSSQYSNLIKLMPFIDIVLISFVVFFSGGIESKFAFLYVLPCLSFVLFSLRDVIKTCALSLIAYALIILADYYNFFPTNIVIEYTIKQLAVANILRIALIISIAVVTTMLLFVRIMRMNDSKKEKDDYALFSIAQKLSQPLENTDAFLESLANTKVITPEIAKKIVNLREQINESIEQKSLILEKNEEPTPLRRAINWKTNTECRLCNKAIGIGGLYWAIPKEYKMSHTVGKYDNDVHCNKCHKNQGATCSYCEVWNKKTS
jgi:hypothetical protein